MALCTHMSLSTRKAWLGHTDLHPTLPLRLAGALAAFSDWRKGKDREQIP